MMSSKRMHIYIIVVITVLSIVGCAGCDDTKDGAAGNAGNADFERTMSVADSLVLPRFQGPLWDAASGISGTGIKKTVDFRRMTFKGLICVHCLM